MNKASYKTIFYALLITFSISAQAQWYQWRGEDRNGICQETNLFKSWPEDGPQLVWAKDSLGDGFSSTIATNKTLYTMGKIDSLEILSALDYKGKVLWQTVVGRAKKGNSWPQSRCTPTFNNNRIYTITVNGDVACVDAKTGKINWQTSYEDFGSIGFDLENFGITESPLIVDEKLILTPCGNKTTIVALDKTTGDVIWQSESLNDSTSFTSPVLISAKSKKAIFASSYKHDLLVDCKDGKILWKDSHNSCMVPQVIDNKIYLTGGYHHYGKMLQWNDINEKPEIIWTDSIKANELGGSILYKDMLIVSGNSKGVFCLDSKTGKTLSSVNSMNSCNFMVADEMLYCYESKGNRVRLLKANDNVLESVGSFRTSAGKGPTIAHLSIADGLLLVRRGNVLMAYNIKKS